ncbi:hypothetical protein CsatB_017771 [Cannabis sativa]
MIFLLYVVCLDGVVKETKLVQHVMKTLLRYERLDELTHEMEKEMAKSRLQRQYGNDPRSSELLSDIQYKVMGKGSSSQSPLIPNMFGCFSQSPQFYYSDLFGGSQSQQLMFGQFGSSSQQPIMFEGSIQRPSSDQFFSTQNSYIFPGQFQQQSLNFSQQQQSLNFSQQQQSPNLPQQPQTRQFVEILSLQQPYYPSSLISQAQDNAQTTHLNLNPDGSQFLDNVLDEDNNN